MKILKVISWIPSQWELHTFYLFEAISLMKTRKNRGGWSISPPEKNQNRNQFVFLSFGVDPLNWQSFIEIGEMACSTTARCSRGHALNCSLAWRAQVRLNDVYLSLSCEKENKEQKEMKPFHISHKFEEKDGGKRKLPHRKFLFPFPLNIKQCPSRWSLKDNQFGQIWRW